MGNIRIDKETGRSYTYHNIPLGKRGCLTSIQAGGKYFTIRSENHHHPEDSWYEGKFIGDRYAVFQWINTSPEEGFYQQVSNWYVYFGRAVNRMRSLAAMG